MQHLKKTIHTLNSLNLLNSTTRFIKLQPRTYLIIFAINQSQFEFELCGIYSKNSGFTFTVKTVNTTSLQRQKTEINMGYNLSCFSMLMNITFYFKLLNNLNNVFFTQKGRVFFMIAETEDIGHIKED